MKRLEKVDEGGRYSLPGICLKQKLSLLKGERALTETNGAFLFSFH